MASKKGSVRPPSNAPAHDKIKRILARLDEETLTAAVLIADFRS